MSSSTCRDDEASAAALDALLRAACATRSPASSSSRWCRAPAACGSTTPDVLQRLRAAGRPLRAAADLRRDLHRLRPHRHDVRLRGGGRRARHHHAVEGADRRHAAARRDGRAQARVRGVLVGRSDAGADARADLHGQRARLRRRQCLARSVRARAAAGAGAGDLASRWRASLRRAAACRASRTCG